MQDWAPKFLESLAASPNVSEACRSAGIARRTAYLARGSDPELAAAWDDALNASLDDLEAKCFQRAGAGSDTLAIFLLKSHRRAVYGDRVDQNHTGGLTVRVEYADAHGHLDAAPAPPGPAGDPGVDQPV